MFDIVAKFENQIAEFYGAPYAVATDSCTHGIEICLRQQKIKKITVPTRTYNSIPFLPSKLNLEWDWDNNERLFKYYTKVMEKRKMKPLGVIFYGSLFDLTSP